MAQIRVLLEERSAARAEVQRLEREKEMQAEQLRMMEERMIDQELDEEELGELEDELERARGESAALAASKESLEQELGWQLAQKEAGRSVVVVNSHTHTRTYDNIIIRPESRVSLFFQTTPQSQSLNRI